MSLRRCALDLLHEEHPMGEHDYCDGQPTLTGPPPAAADGAGLWLAADTPRPWNWASLDEPTARVVRAKLDQWVQHYNHTWAVRDAQLIYACWPSHPAVAYELAALYAAWVDAYCGPLANAGQAMVWLDRWLPGFQMRLRDRFGIGEDACTPSTHNAKWNPIRGKLPDLDKPVEGEPEAVLADLCTNPGLPPLVPTD